MITKNVTDLTTDDLRMYLTECISGRTNNCSKASIDNIRRNLSSLFLGWKKKIIF